jgi:hypothetical protein
MSVNNTNNTICTGRLVSFKWLNGTRKRQLYNSSSQIFAARVTSYCAAMAMDTVHTIES